MFKGFHTGSEDICHLLIQSQATAGCYVQDKLQNCHPVFNLTVYPDANGKTRQVTVNEKDDELAPAIMSPEVNDFMINIRPRRLIPQNLVMKSVPLTNAAVLEGTKWEGRSGDSLEIYLMRVMHPFGFGVDVVQGSISSDEVKQRLLDSGGELAKLWVETHEEVNEHGADIGIVWQRVEANMPTWFPGYPTEIKIRKGVGTVDIIPINKSSFAAEYSSVEMAMHMLKASPVVTAVAGAAASSTFEEKQLKSKVARKLNKFKSANISCKIDFEAKTISDWAIPELTREFSRIYEGEGGDSMMKDEFKSLLDTGNKTRPQELAGSILVANRCMPDHDQNLVTNFCTGNYNIVALTDLANDSLRYTSWQFGKESEAKAKERNKAVQQEEAEENAEEDSANRTKKRILTNHVRGLASDKHLYQLMSNQLAAIMTTIKVKVTPTPVQQCIKHILTVLTDEDVSAWIDKHAKSQPQFWIWLGQSLDRLTAGLASAAFEVDNMTAVAQEDVSKLSTMKYSKHIMRFIDAMDQLHKWVRNEMAMDVIPTITPEYLRPGSSKRPKAAAEEAKQSGKPASAGGQKKQQPAGQQQAPQMFGQGQQQRQQQGMAPPGFFPWVGFGSNSGSGGWGANDAWNGGWRRDQAPAQQQQQREGRKDKGDFVTLVPNFPFVLAPTLKDKKCKARLTFGMACPRGNACTLDHTNFDRWTDEDKAAQILYVKKNSAKVGFNAAAVKSVTADMAGLMHTPEAGENNA